MKLAEVFRARVIDVAPESLILESTGTSDKIAGLLDVLRPFGVLEVARSGHVAMVRGDAGAVSEHSGRRRRCRAGQCELFRLAFVRERIRSG